MKPLARLFSYIKKHPFYLAFSLIFALLFVISMTFVPLLFGKATDEIVRAINSSIALNDTKFFEYLFIALGLIFVVLVFEFLFDYSINYFVELITKDLKDDVFINLNETSISYIDTHPHGDLVSRCINDTDNINTALISAFKQFYQGIIQIITTLIIMFIYNWILALIVTFLTPIGFLLSFIVAKRSNRFFKKQAKVVGEIGGIVLEDFNNIDVIKSFNYEKKSFDVFSKTNDKLYECGQKAQFFSSFTNPTTRLINNSTYAIVGMIAATLCAISFNDGNVILGASCTVGSILVFIQFSNQFAKPFNEISSCITEIQSGLSSLKRVNEILEQEKDIDEGTLLLNDDVKEIDFNHVYFSYVPNRKLIENFSLPIKQGMKVAIVGPTGCGKTTMINLLLRFYDPTSGSIDINGKSSSFYKKSSFRSKFGMVLQDTWIFNGTVKENIMYGKQDATMDEIIEASKRANCYNFIMRLPKGFDTLISDSSGLSVGEKQLICIARVMLRESRIMILDEATSNIDTRTEMKISTAFNKMTEGKTSFMIAHRLQTIINSDLIIVMKDGHIIETGKHEELLEKHGFYYDLYNAQYVI